MAFDLLQDTAVCSKRTFDSRGRPIVVITTASEAGEVGETFLMLGDCINTTVSGMDRLFAWTGRSGRPPTPAEQLEAPVPYRAPAVEREHREAPADEELDDAAAIAFARLEQQREPVDLLSRIAA